MEYEQAMYEEFTGDLEIRTMPNPVLTEPSEAIDPEEYGKDLVRFGAQMIAVMHKQNGVGLAAPQVGLLKRIFVMRDAYGDDLVLCNPVFVRFEGTYMSTEGCLSIPGLTVTIPRFEHIGLVYFSPKGKRKTARFSGLQAAIVQHEMDHLEGILITDRADARRPVSKASAPRLRCTA